jgi:hypothetical protein
MADEQQPREPGGEAGGPEALRPDSFVERFRGDPSQPPQPVRVLEGLLGNSDREGYHRIYFTREFDSYAEFRAEDYVYREPIPPDQPPFLGLDASRVAIKRDAPVWYTQVRIPRPVDEFDLDIRLSGLVASTGVAAQAATACDTHCAACPTCTCPTQCATCPPTQCATCQGATCPPTQCDTCGFTCNTCPGDTCGATCAGTHCNTCRC